MELTSLRTPCGRPNRAPIKKGIREAVRGRSARRPRGEREKTLEVALKLTRSNHARTGESAPAAPAGATEPNRATDRGSGSPAVKTARRKTTARRRPTAR